MTARAALLLFALTGCASGPRRVPIAGALRFECTPPDAHVVVDEEDMGPCVVWGQRAIGLRAGTHRIRVVRDGYFPQESEVVPNGRRVTVRVQLRPVPD